MKWCNWMVVSLLCCAAATAQAKSCKDSSSFGSWRSGDRVADNPGGEDYAADSGTIMQFGCTYFLDAQMRYTANVSIGYRYQLDTAGKGRSSGWSMESSVSANLGGLLLGVGALGQFKGLVRDNEGARTKIEPSAGGFAFVGVSLGRGLELQLRRHYLPLESEFGVDYEAAEYGIFLHQAF